MEAVTSIMRVQQLLMGRLNAELAEFDLSFARYEALMLLFYTRTGSLPLGKISDRLQVHRTSVTNTIDGLERSGYVVREAHPEDRRATLASITDRGREVAERATARLNEDRFGTAPLRKSELEGLFATLERVRVHAGDF